MRINNKIQSFFVLCLLSFTIILGSKNIQAQCIADFIHDTTHALLPTQFTDLSTTSNGVINSWEWDFGDGGSSTLQHPTHVYTTADTYTVCLIIETTLGCSDTTCHSVLVGPQHPQASFVTVPVCEGDSMCFSDQSNAYGGVIASWLWYFGDGQSSTDQNPCHIYTTFGIYNVMLIVTNDFGCQDDTTIQVEVYPNPIANFSDSSTCNYNVYFTDLSIANAVSLVAWEWSFGDGSTSTSQNPVHTYAGAGTYNVCLIVTNSNNCIDSSCSSVTILSAPISDFTYVSDCNLTISFIDMSVVDPGDTIISWSWDFGDGSTSTLQYPVHTYAMSGNYTVSLMVMCICGAIDTSSQVVFAYLKPEADFTYTTYCNNFVNFIDLSIANSANITSWSWDFHDGGTSTVPSPIHYYSMAGTYNVYLSVVNSFGCIDSVTLPVIVTEMPIADFTADTACEGTPTQFTDLSIPGHSPLISWTWDFGDGGTSTAQNPTHIYTSHGIYLVTLIIGLDCGGMDSIAKEVLVEDNAWVKLNSSKDPLFNIFPNPFKDGISISFNLAHPTRVYIEVINSSGKIMANITNEQFPAGEHQLRWNANDLTAGIFIVKIEAGRKVYTTKLIKSP